ncbi:MAG: hypothetical protein LBQ94_00660 [Treponema sp.]|jgi:hypothetical protein|nr:hypothetical protein [Treponema sp.]
MAGKSGILTLILLAAAFALAGCSPPLGSIGRGRNAGSTADTLTVVARPVAYDVGDIFTPANLEITYRGGSVPPASCDVFIDGSSGVVPAGGVTLVGVGTKTVRVEYRAEGSIQTGRCTIQVRDPNSGGNGNGGDGNGGGGGDGNGGDDSGTKVGIVWL